MDVFRIAEKYGFDKTEFERFVKNQHSIRTMTLGCLSVSDKDVDQLVTMYKSQQEAQKRLAEEEQERLKHQELVEHQKQEFAKAYGVFYEYDVVTVLNEGHGRIDIPKMKQILTEHAMAGWKLHTIYSNELGKNALSILGLGVNATACEDVLIFERRIEKLYE